MRTTCTYGIAQHNVPITSSILSYHTSYPLVMSKKLALPRTPGSKYARRWKPGDSLGSTLLEDLTTVEAIEKHLVENPNWKPPKPPYPSDPKCPPVSKSMREKCKAIAYKRERPEDKMCGNKKCGCLLKAKVGWNPNWEAQFFFQVSCSVDVSQWK